jgi:hypothetical protein
MFYGHQFIEFSISGFGAVDGYPVLFLLMALRRYRRGIRFVSFKPFKDICTKQSFISLISFINFICFYSCFPKLKIKFAACFMMTKKNRPYVQGCYK